jgi:hypothetical protein
MKKLILSILLTVTSSSAIAEWTYITSNNIADFYYDKTTILKKNNMVKMWDMSDYKSAQKSPDGAYLSERSLTEYDCTEVRHTSLNLAAFSGNMLEGKIIYTYQYDRKWRDIPPDTVAKNLWEIACGKK